MLIRGNCLHGAQHSEGCIPPQRRNLAPEALSLPEWDSQTNESTCMNAYWRLLRNNPDFTRLWLAQVVSLLGDWFNTIVLAVLVEEYSGGSGLAVSLFLLARFVPPMLVGPWAGVLVDRFRPQAPSHPQRFAARAGRAVAVAGGRAAHAVAGVCADRTAVHPVRGVRAGPQCPAAHTLAEGGPGAGQHPGQRDLVHNAGCRSHRRRHRGIAAGHLGRAGDRLADLCRLGAADHKHSHEHGA